VQRESVGQNVLQTGVPPGPGCGVGLTQITYGVDWSNPKLPTFSMAGASYDLLDPGSNLLVAAGGFLAPAIAAMFNLRIDNAETMNRFSTEIAYFAFAAYNAGAGAVAQAIANGQDPNGVTTDNYASDTLSIYHTLCAQSHGDDEPE
jgi:hypothetical protein